MQEPKVIFRDSDHSYWYGSGPIDSPDRTKLQSVNTVWKSFAEPFDDEFILSKCALANRLGGWGKFFAKGGASLKTLEDLKERFGKLIDDQYWEYYQVEKEDWDYANVKGTEFHDMKEAKAYEDGFIVNPFDGKEYEVHRIPKKYDNQSAVDDLWDLKPGVYPELVIWSEKARTCGQADVPFIEEIDGIKYVDLYDYKTNGGSSEKKGLKKRKELSRVDKSSGYMQGPLSHIRDCKYTAYQGQVSMYMAMMENFGYVGRKCGIGHVLNYNPDQIAVIEYPFLGKECHSLLSYLHIQTDSPLV